MTQNICCIGAGYVGGPSMAVMADRCPGLDITVVDVNQARIDAWNNLNGSELPVFEPGLDSIHRRVLGVNLHFSTDVEAGIRKADMVFLSVNTPTKSNGHGAGVAADLTYIERAARQIASCASGGTIVVERSTLPVRTAEVLRGIFRHRNDAYFDVLSNPEFMAEGSAIADLERPDRVLIGGLNHSSVDELAGIYGQWVPEERILRTNVWSAELAKLTANAFLAQRISSINTIAALCEACGAQVEEVSLAIGHDRRIGPEFLRPGPGFGGSCFRKDILNLIYISENLGLSEVAEYWRSVISINHWSQRRLSRLITRKLFGTLRGKKLAVLGFAFKAHTNDIRESPAIGICRELLSEGAYLAIHDPRVSPASVSGALSGGNDGDFQFISNLHDAFVDSDAVVVLTDWPMYASLDWIHLAGLMRSPACLFDSRNVVDHHAAKLAGLEVWSIGHGGGI